MGKKYNDSKSSKVPDPFKDTRTSNTVDLRGSVSLLSAQSDLGKIKKKQKKQRKKIKNADKRDEKYQKSLDFIHATPERQTQLLKEAEKVGMTYTSAGTYISKKQYEGAQKASEANRTKSSLEKQFKQAITESEKKAIISKAESKGYNMSSDGKIKGRISVYNTPAQVIKIRGMSFDLSVTKARKEAIKMMVTLSPEGRNKLSGILIKLGYDPITGKPIQNQ